MVNQLSPKVVALSLAKVFGIVSLLCALIFVIAPEKGLNLFKDIFHGIDITQIAAAPVTLGSVILGIIEAVVIGLVIGWLFAVVYNFVSKKYK